MQRVLPIALLTLTIAATWTVSLVRADDKPKHSIKDVMKAHKKGGLKDKVVNGTASADEKKELAALYEDLGKSKPPKGDAENWKKLTDALAKAAKEVTDGKESGIDTLEKAVQCGKCHSAHKGS